MIALIQKISVTPKQLGVFIFFGMFFLLTTYILYNNIIGNPELDTSDFVQFYTGAVIANSDITKIYDHQTQIDVQSFYFGMFDRSFRSLPFVARMLQPLALVSPFIGNIIMMDVMLVLFFIIIRLYSHSTRDFIIKTIAVGSFFPLTTAIYNTQITILLASIIGGGLMLMKKSPLLAGVVLAMVLVKPQFMLLPILLAVIAKDRLRYLVGLGAGCLGLIAIGFKDFGLSYPIRYLSFLSETETGYFGTNYFELSSLQTLFSHFSYELTDKLTLYTVLIVLPVAIYFFVKFSNKLNFTEQVLVAMLFALGLSLHAFIFDSLMLIFPIFMLYEEGKYNISKFLYFLPFTTLISINYVHALSYLIIAFYLLLAKSRAQL